MVDKPIGGYFELELPLKKEFHTNAIALNSGRYCLEYILRCRKYSKIYVPYYTCDSAVEPIIKLGIPYEFYHIDENYRIINDISISASEALLYTNYWGMQSEYCSELSLKYGPQLILDYTQAFYANPINGIDTFYSCRKFFGVPDGGYLYTNALVDFDIEIDESYSRLDSLVKRIDLSPEDGYRDFRICSERFRDLSIRYMSRLTRRLMASIDYEGVAKKRRANYELLQMALGGTPLSDGIVPMIFPYKVKDGPKKRKYLINNGIFVAKYWPNVEMWTGKDAIETSMANNILPLPIDQRYDKEDMEKIIMEISNE